MRLFVAIELDEAARTAIAREQRRLAAILRGPGDDGGLRLVPEGQMHLTLAFLGEVTDGLARDVQAALAPAVPVAPYRLHFGGVGVFPARGNPRVLWLGLTDGEAPTRAVYADVAARVTRAGVVLESRPYSPHLTLGRWKEGRPHHRTAVTTAAAGGHVVADVAVSRVTLFESRLSSAGAVHTPLLTSPLRCP